MTAKVDKWVKRWQVPKSSGDGFWTVAIDKEGNYACSCPVWKLKRLECHHILEIKQNGGQEVAELSPMERGELKLRAYAKQGYRYHIFYNEPLQSWDRQAIELLKRDKGISDVKTFVVNRDGYATRIVVIKENELAYQHRLDNFIELYLKKCNLKDKFIRNPWYDSLHWLASDGNSDYAPKITQQDLRKHLRAKWFDIVQHILYNKTGIVNPNLPQGSVYTVGEWGHKIITIERRFKFLR